MDSEGKKFGRGPKELTGAVDLITHYKLVIHHEFFCKKSLPVSVADTHYLHNVIGDTEIRRGEGMQLDQLVQDSTHSRDGNTRIQTFELDALREVFHFRETTPVQLPSAEKGIPTSAGSSKSVLKGKEKHKKHKDRDKEHKPKNRHRDRKDKDKEKKRDKSGHQDSGGDHSKKHEKHKSSRIDEMNVVKVAG